MKKRTAKEIRSEIVALLYIRSSGSARLVSVIQSKEETRGRIYHGLTSLIASGNVIKRDSTEYDDEPLGAFIYSLSESCRNSVNTMLSKQTTPTK